MSRLGDRHGGDLNGQLVAGMPVSVGVSLPHAPTVSDQHTALMLINLLTRLDDVVDRIIVDNAVFSIAKRISPHASVGAPFASAIMEMAANIGGVKVELGDSATGVLKLYVGAGAAVPEGWRVLGNGWEAKFSRGTITPPTEASDLPFGPYAAACLAAAEVFRAVKLPDDRYTPVDTLEVDLWSIGAASDAPAPRDVVGAEVDFGLAGVGAVGVAALHTLWACDGLVGCGVIADNDRSGVDDTNLNRYVLFDRRHVGLPKASTAGEIYGEGQLQITPIDGPYDLDQLGDLSPRVLLSAVDTNRSRRDLQRMLAPGIAFGASTDGLRAELIVFGPPGEGPCLACDNPVPDGIPTDVRRAQVRAMDLRQLAELAAASGHSAETLQQWARTGQCGVVNAEALGHVLGAGVDAPVWSVGFVSVFAGVMLAAQLVRHALGHQVAGEATSSKFQFRLPQAPGNGEPRQTRPDAKCSVCGQDVHRAVWARHRSVARSRLAGTGR